LTVRFWFTPCKAAVRSSISVMRKLINASDSDRHNLANCATLAISDKRERARAINEAFSALGINVSKVLQVLLRCVETAKLAFGHVTIVKTSSCHWKERAGSKTLGRYSAAVWDASQWEPII
jgi:hypothetical protein